MAIDFSVINTNTSTGAVTLGTNTGITVGGTGGSNIVAIGTSGRFMLRKTGAATYTLYRLS